MTILTGHQNNIAKQLNQALPASVLIDPNN